MRGIPRPDRSVKPGPESRKDLLLRLDAATRREVKDAMPVRCELTFHGLTGGATVLPVVFHDDMTWEWAE